MVWQRPNHCASAAIVTVAAIAAIISVAAAVAAAARQCRARHAQGSHKFPCARCSCCVAIVTLCLPCFCLPCTEHFPLVHRLSIVVICSRGGWCPAVPSHVALHGLFEATCTCCPATLKQSVLTRHAALNETFGRCPWCSHPWLSMVLHSGLPHPSRVSTLCAKFSASP